MDLLIKLLIAHLIADFMLQWPGMLSSKRQRIFKSVYLYGHGLIHALLALLLLWDLTFIYGVLVIAASHIVIDGLKLSWQNNSERMRFFSDQLAHLLILVIVANYYQPLPLMSLVGHKDFFAHLLFVSYLTFPASIVIQQIFSRWELPEAANSSLQGAGSYIGIIERLIIYGAVISQNWNMIGFLLAAKSIFRFGDMREAHDRKYTEYIFVGTLLSFASALICGVLFTLHSGNSLLPS